MNNYAIISTNGLYYDLFYNLAFLLALIILLYEGYIRKFPMLKWILLLSFSKLFFIAGSKIVTFSPENWNFLLNTFSLPPTAGKSLLGGILLGSAGIFALKYLLKFRQNFTDAFAIALPLAIGVQRMGCFLSGCCFGTISRVPWAVQYPAHTLPHFHQFQSGLISSHDLISLPVHPVQLYEIIGAFAIVLMIVSFRKKFKAHGSLLLFSLILILAVRFFTEFLRDPLAHTIGGKMFWILNATQWVILPVCVLLFSILKIRESKYPFKAIHFSDNDLELKPAFVYLLILSSSFWILRNWLGFSEMSTLILNAVVALAVISYRLILKSYTSPYRWLYLAGTTVPVLLMGQTVPAGSPDSVFVKTYKTVRIGLATGNFQNSHTIGSGEGCDRISHAEYFDQKYTLAGAAFSVTKIIPENNTQLNYGVKTFLGQHTELRISDQHKINNSMFGITPFVNYDTHLIGIGAGLNMGNLIVITENLNKEGLDIPEKGSFKTPVYPQVYFRLGPQKWIYADYYLGNYFPSAFPGIRHQLGIGSNFGSENGFSLRAGSTFAGSYFSGTIPLKSKFMLEPMFIWEITPESGDYKLMQFSLGVSYRFNQKEELRKRTVQSN